MIALSVRGPWWWFILHAGKRHENRCWRSLYRDIQLEILRRAGGRAYLHAAQGCTKTEYEEACAFAASRGVREFPDFATMPRGGLVGIMEIKGFVEGSTDPWYMGPGALEIGQIEALEFYPLKGALGFFNVWPSSPRAIPLEAAKGKTVTDFRLYLQAKTPPADVPQPSLFD